MQYHWTQQTGLWALAITVVGLAVWILKFHISERRKKQRVDQQLKDITKEKDTYNRIYKSLFESIQNGIFIYKNDTLVDCNKHALNIYGQPREFFEKHYPAECSPPLQPNGENSAEQSRKILEQADQCCYQHFEWVHTKSSLECFDAEVTIFPFESADERYTTVIVQDITERKIMERELLHIKTNLENLVYDQTQNLSEANSALNNRNTELAKVNDELSRIAAELKMEVERRKELQITLEESQEILKNFIAQSSLGISIIQSDGSILAWNPAIEIMTGISQQTALDSFAWDIHAKTTINKEHHLTVRSEIAHYFKEIENGKEFKVEEQYIRADKSIGYVQRLVFPIITNNKSMVGLVCRDLTYEKTLEAQRAEYSKQVDDLLIKQAEKNVELYQKLTAVFNNTKTNIAFFSITDSGIVVSACNAVWASSLNKKAEDLRGKKITEIYTNQELELITRFIYTAIESKAKINEEVEWHANHQTHYLDFSTLPLIEEESEPITQVACFYRDITENRKMERTLIQREAHLARAQELAHLGSWNWDLTTKKMVLSREMYKIYDFDPQKPVKLPDAIFQSVHPDDYERVFAHVSFCKEHTLSSTIEHRVKLPNGQVKHLRVLNNTIGDINGVPVLIEGTTQDITKQKLLEQSIRESEAKFREIFENSLDTISLIDCETNKYYDVNRQFIKITGINKEDAIGKSRDEINVWAHRIERDEYTKLLQEHSRVVNFRMHWNVLGGPRYFLLSTEKISINGKQYFLTTSADIEEQHRMELALEESAAKFRNIFNASTDGILLTSKNFKFIDCNPAILTLVGHTKATLIHALQENFVSPSFLPLMVEREKTLRRGEYPAATEIQIIHKDGSLIPVEISSKFIHIADRDIVLTQIRNLSQQKKMEEKLITSTVEAEENERRKLAQDLHDDVGPLLSSMNMYLSLLARKPELKPHEPIVRDIEKILKETIATVREISNKISPHILINFGLMAALNNFFLNNERLVPVHITGNLNRERLSNLMELMLFRIIKEAYNNTVKHAEATRVDLSINRSEGILQITYCDNGKGFDMANKQATSIGGLGLYTIQSRLTTMGGQLSIKTAPGEGFYLYISVVLA